MEERNKNLSGLKAYSFSKEWETTRLRVLEGLKRLGHDIPLTHHTAADVMKEMTQVKRNAGISKR